MDCSSTAAFLQSQSIVDYTTEDDKGYEVFYTWFNMDPANVRDHMVDGHVNLHRRGYSFCIQQGTSTYKMTDEEYMSLNVMRATLNPMSMFALHTWEHSLVWHTQFTVNWRDIIGRQDADRHHTVLIQALEVHGFEIVDYYIQHNQVDNVKSLMKYIRRFTIQMQPSKTTSVAVPPGHPRYRETIEGLQVQQKKARTTAGEKTG